MADFLPVIVAILAVGVVIGVLQVAWKFLNSMSEKYKNDRRDMLLVQKLVTQFPNFAAELTLENAPKIFKAQERREEDFSEAWHADSKREIEHENVRGASDPDYKMIEPDDFERRGYFAAIFSDKLLDHLTQDVMNWRLFQIAVQNSKYETSGARRRVGLNAEGKVVGTYPR